MYVSRLNPQEAARAPAVGDPADKLDVPGGDHQPPWSSNPFDVGKIWRVGKSERGRLAFLLPDGILFLVFLWPGWLLVEESKVIWVVMWGCFFFVGWTNLAG